MSNQIRPNVQCGNLFYFPTYSAVASFALVAHAGKINSCERFRGSEACRSQCGNLNVSSSSQSTKRYWSPKKVRKCTYSWSRLCICLRISELWHSSSIKEYGSEWWRHLALRNMHSENLAVHERLYLQWFSQNAVWFWGCKAWIQDVAGNTCAQYRTHRASSNCVNLKVNK